MQYIKPKKISDYFLVGYFLTLPIYLLPSGSIQIFHLLTLCLFLGIIFFNSLKLTLNFFEIIFIIFSAYVFTIEVIRALIFPASNSIISAMYIVFNFFTIYVVKSIYIYKGIRIFYSSILLLILFEFLIIFQGGISFSAENYEGRSIGTFNNPNQLGFFTVLLVSGIIFLHLINILSFSKLNFFIFLILIMSAVSLSKASFISIIFGLYVFYSSRSKFSFIFINTLSIILSVSFMFLFEDFLIFERIMNIQNESDSSLASRGYYEILNHGAFSIMFGLGSSQIENIIGHEVHSTFASVLNNFGIFAFLIFIFLAFYWFIYLIKSFGVVNATILALPILMYGITHNGTRFSLFWVFVALTVTYCQQRKNHDNFS